MSKPITEMMQDAMIQRRGKLRGDEGRELAAKEYAEQNETDLPYTWVTSGILADWQRNGVIDPAKVNTGKSRNFRSGKPGFLYTNQLGMPKNVLYASHRNSHNGSHWLEKWKGVKQLDLSDKDVGAMANGISFELSPEARLSTIKSVADWRALHDKYGFDEFVKGDDEFDPHTYRMMDWDKLSKDFDAVYLHPDFVKEWKGLSGKDIGNNDERRRHIVNADTTYANLDIEGPDHMFILNGSAIGKQKPYIYNDVATRTKRDVNTKEKYPEGSYAQQVLKEKSQKIGGDTNVQ